MVYLIFNEGYAASSGDALVRRELSAEAIRLARIVVSLLPDEPEAAGLLALMLLHDARREARVDPVRRPRPARGPGSLALGRGRVSRRVRRSSSAPSRAVVPARTRSRPRSRRCTTRPAPGRETDWRQIVELYRRLLAMDPSPVVELNLGVAVAMADGPPVGLAMIDGLAATGALDTYPYLHAARADLLRRLGRRSEAAVAYRTALGLTDNGAERAFLQRRLDQCHVGGAAAARLLRYASRPRARTWRHSHPSTPEAAASPRCGPGCIRSIGAGSRSPLAVRTSTSEELLARLQLRRSPIRPIRRSTSTRWSERVPLLPQPVGLHVYRAPRGGSGSRSRPTTSRRRSSSARRCGRSSSARR